jgi:hypothetical protein
MSDNDYSLIPILTDVFEAKIEYLNAAIKIITDKYTSIDNFLINVLDVDIQALKEKYLK